MLVIKTIDRRQRFIKKHPNRNIQQLTGEWIKKKIRLFEVFIIRLNAGCWLQMITQKNYMSRSRRVFENIFLEKEFLTKIRVFFVFHCFKLHEVSWNIITNSNFNGEEDWVFRIYSISTVKDYRCCSLIYVRS